MIVDLQLLGLLFLSFGVFGLHFWRVGRIRISDPAFLFFAMFGLGTGTKLLYFVFFRAKDTTETLNLPRYWRESYDPVTMGKDESFLVVGMLFITLSAAAYCLGLWHQRSVTLQCTGLQLNERLLLNISLIACVATSAGLVLFLYRTDAFATGEFFAKRFNDIPSGATDRFFVLDYWLFKALSSVKYFFYGLLVYWIWRGERAGKRVYALIAATLLLSLLVPSVVGSRAHVFVILLDLVVLATLTFRWRRFAFLSILIVIATTFTSATVVARHTRPSDPLIAEANNRRIIEQQKAAAAIVQERGSQRSHDAERIESSLWFTRLVGADAARRIDVQMTGRYFLCLYKTAHIVDDVPERTPFLHGQSFIGWLFVLVPESVWPDKPIFARMAPILAARVFLEPANNIPPGLVGEAWLNFGWFGILAVGAVGSLMGLAHNFFLYARHDAIAQVLYAMLLTRASFVMFNTSFGDAILKISIDTLPILLLLLVVRQSGIWRSTDSPDLALSDDPESLPGQQ